MLAISSIMNTNTVGINTDTDINRPSTMYVENYVATRGTVFGSWEEPEGICTEIHTEYGRGILADGYYSPDVEYIVVFDTKGTWDNYFDDEIVQIIPAK